MSGYRFFKCNVLGGFRLSDLNKHIKQGEYFFLDSHIAETSRAAVAALRERWMVEISEKEASKFLKVPRETTGVQESNVGRKVTINKSAGLAIPNAREVNKSLESRQAEANFSKPILPNFKEVEEKQKIERRDSINKIGASTDQELLKGSKDIEKVATPDFSKRGKPEEVKLEVKVQDVKEFKEEKEEETVILEKVTVVELEKNDVTVNSNDSINSLVDDKAFDNSLVSTPNFDEKKEEVKKDIAETVIKRRRMKRKSTETVE